MAREREDTRPTAPPSPIEGGSKRERTSESGDAERTTTTELVAWRVVADLLANLQRDVALIEDPREKRRIESELRPIVRAITGWQTVPPQAVQSKNVLERLLELQDELSEKKRG